MDKDASCGRQAEEGKDDVGDFSHCCGVCVGDLFCIIIAQALFFVNYVSRRTGTAEASRMMVF